MNLFSVFDPCSYYTMSLNWIVFLFFFFFFFFFFFPMSYFYMQSGKFIVIDSLLNQIVKIFNEMSGSNKLVIVFFCMMVFVYLVSMNLLGLYPYIFSSTAHPVITMGLGVVVWFSFFIMGWMKNFKISSAHLVPEGSPIYMAPFMVVIEVISHLMRPFTLSIRLAANIMAGHLILGLLASVSMVSFIGALSSFLLQSILLILEFGVMLIQSFVFSILVLLYVLEYY